MAKPTVPYPHSRRVLVLVLLGLLVLAGYFTFFHIPDPYQNKAMLRNHIPPLFHPHRSSFECRHEAQAVPPIDAQADAWLQEALDLESPDIPSDQRDWGRIVELTRAAAQKQHWQAMLNLVNLRLEGRGEAFGLPYDREAAVREVEAAMALGIPAAFDKMGNFYDRGMGVDADISAAYAFYQHAADLGHPPAMTFLAEKMKMTEEAADSPGRYANVPIATQMLECAFAQGYGPAAYILSMIQTRPLTPEAKAQALRTLHEGVKMGDKDCAGRLAGQFNGFFFGEPSYLPPQGIDKARAERYRVIANRLSWYGPRLKLPNLDAILPLPPAKLPSWDGDRETLFKAAKARIPGRPIPKTPQHSGRAHIPEGHVLQRPQQAQWLAGPERPARWQLEVRSAVEQSGYWQPRLELPAHASAQDQVLAGEVNATAPQHYALGERFEDLPQWDRMTQMQRYQYLRWHYVGEATAQTKPYLPRVSAGLALAAQPLQPGSACRAGQACPHSGIWLARVAPEHEQAAAFNTWWRQAPVDEGARLPGAALWPLAHAGVRVEDKDILWWPLQLPQVEA